MALGLSVRTYQRHTIRSPASCNSSCPKGATWQECPPFVGLQVAIGIELEGVSGMHRWADMRDEVHGSKRTGLDAHVLQSTAEPRLIISRACYAFFDHDTVLMNDSLLGWHNIASPPGHRRQCQPTAQAEQKNDMSTGFHGSAPALAVTLAPLPARLHKVVSGTAVDAPGSPQTHRRKQRSSLSSKSVKALPDVCSPLWLRLLPTRGPR